MIYEVSITEAWAYTDTLVPSINIGTFGDALTFYEGITNNVVMVSFVDSIHYAEVITPGPVELNLDWTDELDFSETITPKDIIGTLGDVLQLIDEFEWIDDHLALDTLTCSEDWVVTTAKGLHDTFEYVEVWSYDHSRTIITADTLTLADYAHGYFNDPWISHYPVVEQ